MHTTVVAQQLSVILSITQRHLPILAGVVQLGHEAAVADRGWQRVIGIGSQSIGQGREQQAITQLRENLAGNTQMPGCKAVVLEDQPVILVVDRGSIEWVTNGLSPVLPAGIEVMVVIFVLAANVAWVFGSMS